MTLYWLLNRGEANKASNFEPVLIIKLRNIRPS